MKPIGICEECGGEFPVDRNGLCDDCSTLFVNGVPVKKEHEVRRLWGGPLDGELRLIPISADAYEERLWSQVTIRVGLNVFNDVARYVRIRPVLTFGFSHKGEITKGFHLFVHEPEKDTELLFERIRVFIYRLLIKKNYITERDIDEAIKVITLSHDKDGDDTIRGSRFGRRFRKG